MKRHITLVLALTVISIAIYYLLSGPGSDGDRVKGQPISVHSDSDPFNASFAELLASYYQLKDALVNGDTTAADLAAARMMISCDSVRLDELKGDTSGAVRDLSRTFLMEINDAARHFNQDPGIAERRRKLEQLTDLVWNLARSVRYTGGVVYYQFCPMAFDNKGAYWLSNENVVLNPYFGQEMLTCGRVMDSINYSSSR